MLLYTAATLAYGAAEYVRCSNASGNIATLSREREGLSSKASNLVTVLPLGSAASVVAWIEQYQEALQHPNEDAKLAAAARLRDRWANTTANTPLAWLGSGDWLRYINRKLKMLETLEQRAGMRKLLHGCTILDVGAGNGFLSAYLMAALNASVTALDIPYSYQCNHILHSPCRVNFYEGVPISVRNKSFDAVLFNTVLHHAAGHAPALLAEAARIAKSYLVLIEDLDNGDEAIRERNKKHDGQGIFRSDAQWRELFRERCSGFALLASGYVGQTIESKHPFRFGPNVSAREPRLCLSVAGDEPRRFQKWYVLQAQAVHRNRRGFAQQTFPSDSALS